MGSETNAERMAAIQRRVESAHDPVYVADVEYLVEQLRFLAAIIAHLESRLAAGERTAGDGSD